MATIRRWREIMRRRDINSTAKLLYVTLDDTQGKKADSWPQLRTLAVDLGVGVSSIQAALKQLTAAGLVTVVGGRGIGPRASNRYTVSRTTCSAHERTTRSAHGEACAPQTTIGAHHRPPSVRTTDHQGICPLNEPNERAHKRTSPNGPRWAAADLAKVYDAYPRKVARPKALEAIGKALATIEARGEPDPASWLLERVQTFASSPAGQAGRFTPHPATFFGRARFDDDPAEWNRDAGRAPRPGRSFPEDIRPKEL